MHRGLLASLILLGLHGHALADPIRLACDGEIQVVLTGSVSMAGDAQRVSSLTPKDVERLAQQRAAMEKYLGDEHSKQNYKTASGKPLPFRDASAIRANHRFAVERTMAKPSWLRGRCPGQKSQESAPTETARSRNLSRRGIARECAS